jgi:hypothetical protein
MGRRAGGVAVKTEHGKGTSSMAQPQGWAVEAAQHVAEAIKLARGNTAGVDSQLLLQGLRPGLSQALYHIDVSMRRGEAERLIVNDGMSVAEAVRKAAC